MKHQENVALISSNNSLLYLMHTGLQLPPGGTPYLRLYMIALSIL